MSHPSHDGALRRALIASTALTFLFAVPAWAEDDAKTDTAATEDAAPQLEGVVVTAPRMEQPLVIETDPRAPRTPVPPSDGAGYLKSIPGFSVVRQSGVDGDPLLRGQGGSRLNILLDGAPVLGGCPNRMDPPTAYIFPDSFDKLTVLKGPQSVVHGGGALGTVLIDRQPQRAQAFTVKGAANALYGSRDRNDETLEASVADKPGFVRAIATHSSADDYKDGNGNAVHSNYWRNSGTAIAGWTPDNDTLLQVSFDKSQAQAASTGSMDGTQFDREGVNVQLSKANITPWLAKLQAQLYHNYVDHIMDVYSMRYSYSSMMNMGASQVDHLMQGGKLSAEFTPRSDTRLTVGLDVNRDEHSSRSQSYTEYRNGIGLETKERRRDFTFETYSGYVEVNHDLSAVNRLLGGYRYSLVEADRANVSPSLSDSRNLHSAFGRYEHDVTLGGPATLYVGYGHAERAPDYWERNKTTTARTFDLSNEATEQLDVGALFTSGPWRGSTSLFYAYTDSYILVAGSNAKSVDARRYGGEGEIAYALSPRWSVEATAAYVRGDNLTESRALAQTPPLDTSLAVKYDDGVFLGGLHLRAVAGQDRIDAGWGNIMSQDRSEGGAGGFAVLSANGGWRVRDGITLTAGIDNILDKAYAEHVSKTGINTSADLAAYNDAVRVNEPGRTFWMRGAVKF